MHYTRKREMTSAPAAVARERRRLIGFGMLMLVSGAGLGTLGGAPRLPDATPRLAQLTAVLSGSTLPIQPLALLLLDLAWLLWAWIVGSLCLEVVVEVAEGLGRGAMWARSLRQLADHVTFPLARRAVAAAFAVQILSRGVGVAAAQPLTPAETSILSQANSRGVRPTLAAAPATADAVPLASYVVRAGDTLWSIAEQTYGSGSAYRRLVDANTGRRMPDGHVFTAQGVIRPGWELVLPEPDAHIEELDGQRWYTVQAGDSLSALAAEMLGDDAQWPTLFELNRGAPGPDGKHTLTNPNVIWPGLRLRLPPQVLAPVDTEQPSPADLFAASTPPSAVAEPGVEPAKGAADGPTGVFPQQDLDPLPLLRTLHVVESLSLEPPADADPAAGSAVPDAGSPPGDQDVALATPPSPPERALAPAAVGGLGLVALAGVAIGARHLRRLRPLPHEPESEVVVDGGFAEAQPTRDFTRSLHGAAYDPIAAIANHVGRFLEEYNLGHVKVVAVRHGRSATMLTLACGLDEQTILVDLALDFAARLEAEAEAWVSADQDVVYRLSRMRKNRLLPPADAVESSPCLVPLGVLYDRQEFLATSTSLGHVLIASMPGHGAETVLTSLLGALSARRSPQQLRVWMIARPRAVAAAVFDLPHLVRVIDPEDEPSVGQVVEELRAELDGRALEEPSENLVVVIPELTSLGDHAGSFELLANRAAALGVRFLAATTCPQEAVHSPLLGHFGTRMVLRMQDEESSVAMLGVADAAFLGGGGRLLLRLDGREPVELYGYHVAPEHLERLVRVMRSAYPSESSPPQGPGRPPAPTPPIEDVHAGTLAPEPAPTAPPVEPASPTPVDLASESATTAGAAPSDCSRHTVDADAPVDLASRAGTSGGNPGAAPDTSASSSVPVEPSPPIEVICFGGPRVLCAGQQVWPRRPGGEAKPWEFLLYLACQPAEGISSEDAVQALWPEDDEALDVPHRFRQLRYRLRHQLANVAGAPATDGICFDRGTLRLDSGVIYSDAQEFLGLVRSARISPGSSAVADLERARDLYQGDLLEGPEARRYAWVDERDDSGVTLREHFRRLYEQLSTRLAESYAVSGRVDAAVDLYRELTDIDPCDERLWRALFRLHADRGERLSLVREERRMRAALRNLAVEIGDTDTSAIEEPSRETVQEYRRLLESLQEREPAAV